MAFRTIRFSPQLLENGAVLLSLVYYLAIVLIEEDIESAKGLTNAHWVE